MIVKSNVSLDLGATASTITNNRQSVISAMQRQQRVSKQIIGIIHLTITNCRVQTCVHARATSRMLTTKPAARLTVPGSKDDTSGWPGRARETGLRCNWSKLPCTDLLGPAAPSKLQRNSRPSRQSLLSTHQRCAGERTSRWKPLLRACSQQQGGVACFGSAGKPVPSNVSMQRRFQCAEGTRAD